MLPKTASERMEHLRKVAVFEDLWGSDQALTHLAEKISAQVFPAGSSVIKEGDPGTEMFILIHGVASIFKTTSDGDLYKVALLKSENHPFFGEGALLDSDARTATIVADSECFCLVLSQKHFEEFAQAFPQWALPVLKRIARAVMLRLKKTNQDLSLLYHALIDEIRGR